MQGLKGYDFKSVSKRIIIRDLYLLSSEINGVIERDALNKRMLDTLNLGGQVYFIRRKKEVCGIVRVDYKKYQASDFVFKHEDSEKKDWKENVMDWAVKVEEDTSGLLGDANRNKEEEKKKLAFAYELAELVLIEDLKNCESAIKDDVLTMLKEVSSMSDNGVKVYIWNDTVIADKTLGKIGTNAVTIGMCIGMLAGALFGTLVSSNHGNYGFLGMYVAIGLCIGMALGSAYSDIAVKRSEKKSGATDDVHDVK